MKVAFIFGIGQRSGTNFLRRLLKLHPYCQKTIKLQEDWFISGSSHLMTYVDSVSSHWGRVNRHEIRSELLQSLGRALLTQMAGQNSRMLYITKTPSAQGLSNFFRIFPESKAIILIRYGKDLIESMVRSNMSNYQQGMKLYAANGQIILDFQEQWQSHSHQFLILYYENLVTNVEQEAKKVFNFLELDPALVSEEALRNIPIVGSSTNKGGKKEVHWLPVYDKSGFNPLKRSAEWSEDLHQQYEQVCGTITRKLGYTSDSNQVQVLPNENISIQADSESLKMKIMKLCPTNSRLTYWYRKWVEIITGINPNLVPPQYHYYNETQNDRWIIEYIFPGKKQGYFLEVGAADGRNASSCYLLEHELDWTGICVEPHHQFFEELKRNRPHSICENLCLADKAGTVIYIEGDNEQISPYLSGIKDNLEAFKYPGTDIVAKGKAVEKEAITLEQLLKKHKAPEVIDYAAFDIEGSELKVLEKFPFEEYIFLALTLECDNSIWEPITELLESNGYREVKNPFNQKMPWKRYWLHQEFNEREQSGNRLL